MNDFLKCFLGGLVASLPSIVAALGIVINNCRATYRQKKDRNIRLKVELLEKVYGSYEEVSDSYLVVTIHGINFD